MSTNGLLRQCFPSAALRRTVRRHDVHVSSVLGRAEVRRATVLGAHGWGDLRLVVRPDASMAGHFFLQPSTKEELLRWAESRPGLIPNPADPGCRLTQALKSTIVGQNVPCP